MARLTQALLDARQIAVAAQELRIVLQERAR
jgi:hypothetical protein